MKTRGPERRGGPSKEPERSDHPSAPAVPQHVGERLTSVAELFENAERRVGRHQLAIERVTEGVGRPSTAYLLLLAFLGWMAVNGAAQRFGAQPPDPPPFAWMQVVLCIASLLMTVTILTTQNRVAKLAQRRALLDLQVNLIAEEKVAKVIALLEELRRDLPSVKNRRDSLAEAMTDAVDVHAVDETLDARDARK